MKILFLEPFFGGSHKYFALGLKKYSRHTIDLLTLPGRFWKWRMRGAALEFLKQAENLDSYDLVLAGNLMDLAQWKALTPGKSLPLILYIHENQLAYPLKPGEQADFQYGWTDYTNQLCADDIIYNSRFNRDSFFQALTSLISRLPDCRPSSDYSPLLDKTSVIPPGCLTGEFREESARFESTGEAPLILWNHRWEHDKNPDEFFRILKVLQSRGDAFRLALLGEAYGKTPACFENAGEEFQKELVHRGYAKDRNDYEMWLSQADFVISTAVQENFGISIVEAASYGVIPLVPDRLAYPEVIPEEFHSSLIFTDQEDFLKKWDTLVHSEALPSLRKSLSESMRKYSWQTIAEKFDFHFEEVLNGP